jgi:hypothetical protein
MLEDYIELIPVARSDTNLDLVRIVREKIERELATAVAMPPPVIKSRTGGSYTVAGTGGTTQHPEITRCT